jgi:hypothetical protein
LRRLQWSASQPAGSVDHDEADHHRREDQHDVVVDSVGEIEEAYGDPPGSLVLGRIGRTAQA